jgi:hypothetical protein
VQLALLIIGVLAVWRATHLLQAEDGPWELLYRLRRRAGGGFWGQLLGCFYCLSLWVALPAVLLLAADPREGALLWLALSGGAILLERATARPAPYVEDPAAPTKEEDDVVLR